jgi:transposase
MVTIEDLVPRDHFVRKLEETLHLGFIYEETSRLYNHRYGRPPIDPVMLVKYLMVGYLYGIPSERQIEQRIQTDVALRWYLGLDLLDAVPDHSTISQNRRRRPAFRKLFRRLFEEVVRQCVSSGLVSGRLVATDSTHVKASASRACEYLSDVEESPGAYWERLDGYEEEALEELREKRECRREKRKKQVRKYTKHPQCRVSRTDPDAGYLNRPGKPKGMHYLSHQSLDTDHGIILDVAVTPGNCYDNEPYLDQLERVGRIVAIHAATADAAYDFPLAHRVLEERNIAFYVRPQKQGDTSGDFFPRDAFVYDAERDAYRCPGGKVLGLNTLRRSSGGLHWVYTADRADCQGCPLRDKCFSQSGKRGARKVERNYFAPSVQRHLAELDTPVYQQALAKRQIWCEGTFAAQKWGNNLTRVLRRGLEAAEDHCLFSATALNLKRMIRCLG